MPPQVPNMSHPPKDWMFGGGVCDFLSVMQECGQFAMGVMAQVIGTLLIVFSHFLVEK